MLTVLAGTAALTATGFALALLLARASTKFKPDSDTAVAAINRLLPQTQCAQCGYPGCRPYAEAIAAGEAINRCPPGGEATIRALADLLGREATALDSERGQASDPQLAVIREEACIGCTLCIQACPVDAIIGAPQLMHTVIAQECTGCELCIPPCPVDCIDLVPAAPEPSTGLGAARNAHRDPNLPGNGCIRCGWCESVCPRHLAPQNLFWFRDSDEALERQNLDACIECRICDRVCPDELPLTATFQASKARIAERKAAADRARHVEARYERHERRQQASKQRVRARPSRDEASALLETLRRDT